MSADNAPTDEPALPIPPHAGWLKAVVVLATLMQVLDQTVANVALPHMQAALSANQESLSWVLTSYILAAAVVLPITGWLADRVGRRKLYLASVSLFILASLLCGTATTLEQMVLFRIAQGLAGAFVTPLALTILLDSTPPEKHGEAMAMFGMGVVLGPVLGPIVGGWLTENLGWRWVFYINLPLGMIALVGLWILLPEVKRPARPFDVTGFTLLAITLASLQLMLDRGQGKGWFDSTEIWIELIVALSALWMFAVHSMTAKAPLFDRALGHDSNLFVGSLLQGITGAIMISTMALLPLMLEGLLGYPVLDAGIVLATRGLGIIAMTAISGKIVNRVAPSILISAGLSVIALTLWEMSLWSLDVSGSTVALNGFIQGMGLGLLFVPISAVAFATLPPRSRTDGSVIISLARSIGSSAGVSIIMAMFNRNIVRSHADLVQHVTPYRTIDPITLGVQQDLSSAFLSMLEGEIARQATMIAFIDCFRAVMIVAFCAIPLTLLIRASRDRSETSMVHVIE